jgi:hypothetical protein
MKKIILFSVTILITSGLFAQGVYNSGVKITVSTGTYLIIGGANANYQNETNVTNGSIDLSGTLTISGNITNNVSGADILGTVATGSSVVLNGTAPQTLGGTTTAAFLFPSLTINNSTGIVLSKNARVNGNMTFTSGLVNIGNSNFTFGPLATVAGAPSPTSMIVATGTGQVQKMWSAIGSFTFPIGDNNVTAKYSPVSLNFTGGTFAAGAVTGLNVVNTKYNDPTILGSYLNKYWNLTQTGITTFTCDALFQYQPTDVTGTESSINGVRVVPTPFSFYTPANATLHQLSATGLTSLGTFTGALYAQANKTLNLSAVMLEGLYSGLGTMRQAQGALGANWPAGVADHITVELHSATTYPTIVFTALDIPLSTTGTATVTIPSTYSGSYFITIKHRNSVETTTATAISFAGSLINQSFGALANVFGSNLGLSIDSHYLIYGGDVNQDGFVDSGDYTPVVNDNANYVSGYLSTDVNGDGFVDSGDYTIVVNNNAFYIGTSHP